MPRSPLTPRQAAEAIEQFGDDLAKLNKAFDKLCERMSFEVMDRVNDVDHQDELSTIAMDFQALGAELSRDCDAADEAEDERRRINVGGHADGGSAA